MNPETPSIIAAKILEAEARLLALEEEVAEIGLPASHELKRRVDALRVEEHALKRNFEATTRIGESDAVRMAKVESLLRHIEDEEASVGHDADFLSLAAPSSMGLAVQAGAEIVDLARRGMRMVVGEQPLGSSAFVNHTHDDLGMQDADNASTPPPDRDRE